MKKTIKIVTSVLILFIIVYLCGAFIIGDINAFNWAEDSRINVVMFTSIIGFIYIVCKDISTTLENKKK